MNFAAKYRREFPSSDVNCLGEVGKVVKSESAKPKSKTGIATANPASGPAIPISRRTFLLRGGAFNLMKAPMVPNPNIEGKGMKYGSVTGVL